MSTSTFTAAGRRRPAVGAMTRIELRLMFLHQGNGVLRMGGRIFKSLFHSFDESANDVRIGSDVIFHRDDTIGVEIRAKVRIDEGADLLGVVALNSRKIERDDVKPAIHRQTEKEVRDRTQPEIASSEQAQMQERRFAKEFDNRE